MAVIGLTAFAGVRNQHASHAATLCAAPTVPTNVSQGLSSATAYVSGSYSSGGFGGGVLTSSPSSIMLAWSASTAGSGCTLTGYHIFRNGVQVGSSTTTAYTDTGLQPLTSYTYSVTAYDNSTQQSALSQTVSLKTAADTVAPTVALTAPATGSAITVGTTTAITVTAADDVAVTKVEFYIDNVMQSSGTTAPYSYSWNTTGIATGTHTLSAKAYDAAGNVSTSGSVTVTLQAGAVTVPGDVNGDKRVNAIDLSILLSHDGQNYPPADFNGDGTVGAADLAIMLGHWTW